MFFYLLTFRALTGAQNARKILAAKGISSQLQRAPKKLFELGCGYALRINSAAGMRAVGALQDARQSYGHVYRFFPNGTYEEVLK